MTLLSLLLCRGDNNSSVTSSCYGSPNVVVDQDNLANNNKERELTIKQGSVEDQDVSNTGSETEGQDIIEEVAMDTVMVAEEEQLGEQQSQQENDDAVEARDETEALSTEQEERDPVADEEEAETVPGVDEEGKAPSKDTSASEEPQDEPQEEAPPQKRSITPPLATRKVAPRYKLSTLFGDSLTVNYDDEPVDTNAALADKAVVAVYIGGGQHKDVLTIFDAGYDARSLAIVYCWVSATDDMASTGFATMPSRWFMAEDYEMVLETCPQQQDNDDEVLIIMDPASGTVLCENALPSLVALPDPAEASYDTEVERLMQSWIAQLNMQQAVIGHMEIPRASVE